MQPPRRRSRDTRLPRAEPKDLSTDGVAQVFQGNALLTCCNWSFYCCRWVVRAQGRLGEERTRERGRVGASRELDSRAGRPRTSCPTELDRKSDRRGRVLTGTRTSTAERAKGAPSRPCSVSRAVLALGGRLRLRQTARVYLVYRQTASIRPQYPSVLAFSSPFHALFPADETRRWLGRARTQAGQAEAGQGRGQAAGRWVTPDLGQAWDVVAVAVASRKSESRSILNPISPTPEVQRVLGPSSKEQGTLAPAPGAGVDGAGVARSERTAPGRSRQRTRRSRARGVRMDGEKLASLPKRSTRDAR